MTQTAHPVSAGADDVLPRLATAPPASPKLAAAPSGAESDLVSVYNQYFSYRLARTRADQEAAYRLRYEVYCEETGFLPKDDNPGGLERDEHDDHALQSVLFHKATNAPVGTVRVVLPRADQPGHGLPARCHAEALDALSEAELPSLKTGEISRFSIAARMRKRRTDGLYPGLHDPAIDDPRRVLPHMTLGLMTSIFEMAVEARLTHLCAIIDPALMRLLRMLGLQFTPVGARVDFHGPRQPVYASVKDLLDGVAAHSPQLARVISADGRFTLDQIIRG